MNISEKVKVNRSAIIQIVESNNTLFPRIILDDLDFDLGDMHLDILVDRTSDFTMVDIHMIKQQLESLLGISVDVFTPNLLPDDRREKIMAATEAI
jgi:uncharacterized protein